MQQDEAPTLVAEPASSADAAANETAVQVATMMAVAVSEANRKAPVAAEDQREQQVRPKAEAAALGESVQPAVAGTDPCAALQEMIQLTTNAEPTMTEAIRSVEIEMYDPARVVRGCVAADDPLAPEAPPSDETPQSSALQTQSVVQSKGSVAPFDDGTPSPAETVQSAPDPATEVEVPTTAEPPSTPILPIVDPVQAEVRATWILMFGSRYEDEIDDEICGLTPESTTGTRQPQLPPTTTRSSLRQKLNQERRLDRQIQATRSKVRKRPKDLADPDMGQSWRSILSRSTQSKPNQAGWQAAEDRPLEDAGWTATVVRLCVEKSMRSTAQCLTQLHAVAQQEPEPAGTETPLGLFMTQWELDAILNDVEVVDSSTSSSGTATRSLGLHNPDYRGLPLQTLLQVSWFLPLDQLTRLRRLVAEISHKRLSESRVARLNAALHRHFVLRPHPGVRMQRLLRRVVDALSIVGATNSNQHALGDDEGAKLVVELLHALHLRAPLCTAPSMSIRTFMQQSPFELTSQLQLTSVVVLQRIIFFRLLIESLAAQKANQPTGTNKPSRVVEQRTSFTPSEAPPTPRSKRVKKKTSVRAKPDSDEFAEPSDDEQEPQQAVDVNSEAPIASTLESAAQDPSTSDGVDTLTEALTAALAKLVRQSPWLVDKASDDAPTVEPSTSAATRASFLAADAFQQSLALLQRSKTPVAPLLVAKIEEFTRIVDNLVRELEDAKEPVPAPPPPYSEPEPNTVHVVKPHPLPVQRANSGSFPPPYVATTPSYWTFDPEIPPPATSTGANGSASIPRSVSKAKASPGVGAYDVSRSDRLTFQQQGGYTFAKTALQSVDEAPVVHTPSKPTPKRRHRLIDRSSATESLAPSSSTEPLPQYTHWASAAIDRPTSDEQGDDDTIEDQVWDALRFQQRFVLDDIVQTLLHNGRPVSAPSSQPSRRPVVTRPTMGNPPPPSRVVSRVRSATARAATHQSDMKLNTKSRQAQPSLPPYDRAETRRGDVKQPPRDYEPPADDAHLQWAARVSEFYKAKLNEVAATADV